MVIGIMMRTYQKWRISNCLDAEELTLPTRDAEVAHFAKSMQLLDRRLRESCGAPAEAPPWLHAGIMNQVRSEAGAAQRMPSPRRWGLRLVWTGAGAALIVALWLLGGGGPRQPSALMSGRASDADQVLREAAVLGATAVLSPLESELDGLTRDLDRTADFLLASLP
jgi:hypothetical protein